MLLALPEVSMNTSYTDRHASSREYTDYPRRGEGCLKATALKRGVAYPQSTA